MWLLVGFHLAVLGVFVSGHPWAAFGCLFGGHMVLLAGTLVPGSRLFGPVRTHFQTRERAVWLTFDDGPDPVTTLPTLELLAAHRTRATFYLIGERARAHPELVDAIAAGGHEVANHTQTHPATAFWRLGSGSLRREVEDCQRTLGQLVGRSPRRFRAPAGMHNPLLFRVLREAGLLPLEGWSHRGLDGTSTDPAKISSRLERNLSPGSILLLHEGRPTTVECTRHLLETLSELGMRGVIPKS